MLCLFAQHFPRSVASLLQRGQALKRRFREETVTDLLMNNLMVLGGGLIIVEYPDEPITGADMEWNFINRDSKEFFQVLLQAKRLSEAKPSWRAHRYKELFYRSGASKTLQVQTLCSAARSRSTSTYPAYIFYNLASTCQSAYDDQATRLEGVNLCNAYIVARLASLSSSKTMERRNSTVGTLYPFLFSLTDIFCPSNVRPLGPLAFSPPRFSMPIILSFGLGRPSLGLPLPPRPDQIRERLLDQQRRVSEIFRDDGVMIDLPMVPEVSTSVPSHLEYLIESRADTLPRSSPIDFWRITFISINPTDELGRPTDRSKL